MCVCILAGLYGCAQTTLCVNSSLVVVVVGGHTPVCLCVRVCVLIDGVTAGCQAYLHPLLHCAPVPPSHHSVPSSFNLAAEAKESGSESHQGTLHIFKHHTFRLLSPCLFTLPSLLSPPRSLHSSSPHFCLRFNFSRLPCRPCLPHTERQGIQLRWCKAPCHFCFALLSCFFFSEPKPTLIMLMRVYLTHLWIVFPFCLGIYCYVWYPATPSGPLSLFGLCFRSFTWTCQLSL